MLQPLYIDFYVVAIGATNLGFGNIRRRTKGRHIRHPMMAKVQTEVSAIHSDLKGCSWTLRRLRSLGTCRKILVRIQVDAIGKVQMDVDIFSWRRSIIHQFDFQARGSATLSLVVETLFQIFSISLVKNLQFLVVSIYF